MLQPRKRSERRERGREGDGKRGVGHA